MGTLILRVSARHGRGVEFHRIAPEGFSVGRGLGNALIVPDPYLGAEQFLLSQQDDRLWLDVCDRTNPLRLNGRVRHEERLELHAGDRIETGRSVFTVLDAETAVPPALSLAAVPWERLGAWRAPLAWLLVLLSAVVVAGIDYLKSTGAAQWDELVLSGVAMTGLAMGWAAFWAVLAVLLRRHADFWAHLALAAGTGMLWYGGMELSTYVAYALADDAAAAIDLTAWALGAVLMYLLLRGALGLSTPLRHASLAALGATISTYALMSLQALSESDNFASQPQPVTVLRAPFAKVRTGLDYDSFDAGVAELFTSVPAED